MQFIAFMYQLITFIKRFNSPVSLGKITIENQITRQWNIGYCSYSL